MRDRQFEVRIIHRYCKGCGLCVEVCEPGKIYINALPNKQGLRTAAVSPEVDCTGCLRCATICPDAAIELFRVVNATPTGASQ